MVGFGFGDAVIMELVRDKNLLPLHLIHAEVDDVVFALTETMRPAAMSIAAQLRAGGRRVDLVLESKKLKWANARAEKIGAARVVVCGEKEWADGRVRVRNVATKEESDVAPSAL